MFAKIKRRLNPLTLSRALEIIRRIAARNRPETDKFDRPIETLIDYLGADMKVADITPEQISGWYAHIKELPNTRKPGKHLSPWTVNSYARLIRAFFNHLVKMGHLERTPFRVTIGRLPRLHRKDIPQSDIDKMVKYSGSNIRDRAIVLILRDSGCRVGELVSMTLDNVFFEKVKSEAGKKQWAGYALVYGQKMRKHRYIFFKHEAVKALRLYLETRPEVDYDSIWLSQVNLPITESGVYQMMERVGKAAGVKRFNPHAFRHAKTKELYQAGVPEPIIQALMGHDGVEVTRLYVQFEPDELLKMMYNFPDEKSGQFEQSPRANRRDKPPFRK